MQQAWAIIQNFYLTLKKELQVGLKQIIQQHMNKNFNKHIKKRVYEY